MYAYGVDPSSVDALSQVLLKMRNVDIEFEEAEECDEDLGHNVPIEPRKALRIACGG